MKKPQNSTDEEFIIGYINLFYMMHDNSISCIVSPDRMYIAVAEKFADIYKLPKESIIGKDMDEINIDKYCLDNPSESFQINYQPIINPNTNNNLGRLIQILPKPDYFDLALSSYKENLTHK
jgi:hypothetical protein